jgi:hypothetical protein
MEGHFEPPIVPPELVPESRLAEGIQLTPELLRAYHDNERFFQELLSVKADIESMFESADYETILINEHAIEVMTIQSQESIFNEHGPALRDLFTRWSVQPRYFLSGDIYPYGDQRILESDNRLYLRIYKIRVDGIGSFLSLTESYLDEGSVSRSDNTYIFSGGLRGFTVGDHRLSLGDFNQILEYAIEQNDSEDIQAILRRSAPAQGEIDAATSLPKRPV